MEKRVKLENRETGLVNRSGRVGRPARPQGFGPSAGSGRAGAPLRPQILPKTPKGSSNLIKIVIQGLALALIRAFLFGAMRNLLELVIQSKFPFRVPNLIKII
jgi:hypothetical protein